MTHTIFGNGRKLAESLKAECPENYEVKIGDITEVTPQTVVMDAPEIIILGGAIRKIRADPPSKKWLRKLNKVLKKEHKKVRFGTGFLTHGLPTEKVQGFAKRYLRKIEKSSRIENTYYELLTVRVKDREGPIYEEEMKKAKTYIRNFLIWTQN